MSSHLHEKPSMEEIQNKLIEILTVGHETLDDEHDELISDINKLKTNNVKIDGLHITKILTVNGIRFSFKDGSWGLIRASSNKPSLVIVTESPTSNERKKKIFDFIDDLLHKTGKVGEYDQKI